MSNMKTSDSNDLEIGLDAESADENVTYAADDSVTRKMIAMIESEILQTQQKLESFKRELTTLCDTEGEESAKQKYEQLDRVRKLKAENALLLEKLHESQEAQELLTLKEQLNNEKLHQQKQRFLKLLEKNPTYWEVESVALKRLADEGGAEVVQWEVSECWFGDERVPFISLQTHRIKEKVAVYIKKSLGADDWMQWPEALGSAEVFPCSPVVGSAQQGANALLSALGTSDWERLKTLIKRMADVLEDEANTVLSGDIKIAKLKVGLRELSSTLEGWPLALRFDSVTLKKTVQTDQYRSLTISLDNISLGKKHWHKLEYSLATVDHDNTFGQNPRLEFDESARDVLENWFAESEDGRGLRLELRFARPYALDTNVWQILSDSDQILLAALVSNLTTQLNMVKKQSPEDVQRWEDWHDLASVVKAIMIHNMRPRQKVGA